jgi:hypothetical protein
MTRLRGLLIAGPALAALLALACAAPATAAAQPAAARLPAGGQPGGLAARLGPGATAAAATGKAPEDAALDGDSCVPLQGSSLPYACMASGFYLAVPVYPGLEEYSNGGSWTTSGVNIVNPPGPNEVEIGGEVSCAAVASELPACLIVGVHYNYGGKDVQFAAWGGPDGFNLALGRSPRGASWSSMNDVSCPTPSFCMVVGAAGRKKTSYATAYSWNGRFMRELKVPAPRRSHDVELGGLSCPTAGDCVAVGNYENAAGKALSYAAIWTDGSWKLEETPSVAGWTGSYYNAVSCPSAASCIAVGTTLHRKKTQQFAASWNGSRWRLLRMPARRASGLSSVSCPVPGTCVASGWSGTTGLIERWNAGRWTGMRTVATSRPASGDDFTHVSCVSATSCAAVGFRFNPNPKSKFGERTLAERWNGKTWTLQSSVY